VLLGDIDGQVGSTRIGCQLFEDLCRQYGAATVTEVMELLIQSSASRLRLALAALPDGETEVENHLDNDGTNDEPIRIHVRLSKRGDRVHLDLSGCSAQVAGPVNAVVQVIKAVAAGAVVGLVDHTIPYNDGILQVVDMVCPEGLVINPRFPAPVNAYIPITHLVFNCVTTALGRLVPTHAVAESGLGLGGIAFGYESTRQGDRHVQYEIPETALGGTSRSDGASMIFPMMIFETIQPIEILESEFPVQVTNFGLNCDSAGAGRHRGGIGYVREYKVLEDCLFMSRCAQRRFEAKGVAGGLCPKRTSLILNPGQPDEYHIKGLDELKLSAGDVVRIEMSGGGGWGDPRTRPDGDVLSDVSDGYVSIEGARRDYGRVIRRGPRGEFIVDRATQAK
jgi:N-methylhydantoinase B